MPLMDDCEAEVQTVEEVDNGSTEVIEETFEHLGRTFSDEHPRDPDDDY